MRCLGSWFNPKGIASFSPRLARPWEGLPGVAACREPTLQGLNTGVSPERFNPFRVAVFPVFPWAARSLQPRADRCNPFGIGKPNHDASKTNCYSIENSEEPRAFVELTHSQAFGSVPSVADYDVEALAEIRRMNLAAKERKDRKGKKLE
jgi:hypothetical protein